MKNNIWYKPSEERPQSYTNVVMEFLKPYGNQMPEDEQEPIYECYEMRYYGDGDNYEWNIFEQCSRWCYLDDLVQCSKDICTISDVFLKKNEDYKEWVSMNFGYLEKE